MKFKHLSLVCLLPLIVGCASGVKPTEKDYIKDLYVSDIDDFTICSLQDIHLSIASDLDYEFNYLEKVIRSRGTDPNLIVINGDCFMLSNQMTVSRFFKWIDSLNIPFAYTYGNHDLQGNFFSKFIDGEVRKCKNSVLSNPKDDVFGDANYVVNINEGTEGSSTLKWQIYVFDSNTYRGFSYDIVHEDQIEWFKNETDYSKGVDYVPNLAFMHVPFEEFEEAWNEFADGKQGGGIDSQGYAYYMGEQVSKGYAENDLYETMQKRNTKGVIVAHDHINVTDWHYNKNGDGEIRLIYGMKTGHGIYHNPELIGASFFTLSDGDTFDMERRFVDYSDNGNIKVLSDEDVSNLK